ncbi:hypothetical protein AB0I16_20005 [Streptomyces sp. NPDC050703]|uniref:hypothetical protein n=1 Tax=Streptomyces sp. NPDC050703 TaxID=3157218 RepID=UPI0034346ECC
MPLLAAVGVDDMDDERLLLAVGVHDEAGLLTSERRGTWVYYRVEPFVLAGMGKLPALPDRAGARRGTAGAGAPVA